MITKYIGQKKSAWEDYLDECVYAYNTASHESSKFTPFELMFARKPVLPIDLQAAAEESNAVLEQQSKLIETKIGRCWESN